MESEQKRTGYRRIADQEAALQGNLRSIVYLAKHAKNPPKEYLQKGECRRQGRADTVVFIIRDNTLTIFDINRTGQQKNAA